MTFSLLRLRVDLSNIGPIGRLYRQKKLQEFKHEFGIPGDFRDSSGPLMSSDPVIAAAYKPICILGPASLFSREERILA